MIDSNDYTKQELVYSRNGTGRWAVLAYCMEPSITMVNLETKEQITFGVNGLLNKEFEPIPGELRDHEGVADADLVLEVVSEAGMSEVLLPCPFCGLKPMIYDIEPHAHFLLLDGMKMPDHTGSTVIECWCGAGLIDDARELVIQRWNTRAHKT